MVRRPSWGWVAILSVIFGGLGGLTLARGDDPPPPPPPTEPPPKAPEGKEEPKEEDDDKDDDGKGKKPDAVPDPSTRLSPPLRDPDGPLVFQWFEVGAITRGTTRFLGERGPQPVRADEVNDEQRPLFGGEGEETSKAFGTSDELVDLIRSSTSPGAWESTRGFAIASQGFRRLAVRATPSMLASVASFLHELEQDATRTLTLDVVALRGDAAAAAGPDGLAGAVARGALVPLTGARTVGVRGQQVAGRRGGQFSYMEDYDVEVASDSKGPDPIVGVAHDGLSYVAHFVEASPTAVRVAIDGWWAGVAPIRSSRTEDGDPLETFDSEGRTLSASLELIPGAWTVVPSSGGVSFALRVTVRTCDVPVAANEPLSGLDPTAVAGPLTRRRWSISDLLDPVVNARGTEIRLHPSNFTPPEPPELMEPPPALAADTLLDTCRLLLGGDVTGREGVNLEVRNGNLWANLDDPSAKLVERTLANLRARFLRATRVKATVLSLPLASFPEYLAGLDDGATLLADGGEALLRRPGATVLDRVGLRAQRSQRAAVVGGSRHAYVADFDVEIAEKSFIGNPILSSWLEGVSLDVVAEPAAGGAAVWCEMRFDRSTPRVQRTVPTRFGAIECPSIGLERIRGSFALPLGTTRIVGASLEDGRVTLVLVSANAE